MQLYRSRIFTAGLAAVVGALALALVACGGGDDDPDAPLGTSTLTARDGSLIPTATPYARLPEPTIVSGVTAGAPSSELTYTVEAGDTLSGIAERYETTVKEILALNGMTDPTLIFVGQVLTIPGGTLASAAPAPPADDATGDTADDGSTDDGGGASTVQTYEVQPGDTALGIAFAFDVTIDDLAAANGTSVEALEDLQVGDVLNIPS